MLYLIAYVSTIRGPALGQLPQIVDGVYRSFGQPPTRQDLDNLKQELDKECKGREVKIIAVSTVAEK